MTYDHASSDSETATPDSKTATPTTASPLLVTGLPRTGTSWVGKMLEASGEVVYVNEPLNPQHPPGQSPGVLNARVTHRFQYICDENEGEWLPAFRRTVALRYGFLAELRRNRSWYDLGRLVKYGTAFTVGRWRGRRALLNDPFAVLSVPWLVRRLGCRAVVLVRDPVALVGSWRRLGWQVHFHELLEQPLLVRDLLGEHVETMRSLIGIPDPIARIATLWCLVYRIVDQHYRTIPGVTVRRYEDLARHPLDGFAELYDFFGLTWRDRVRAKILAACASGDRVDDAHRWTLRFGLSKTAFRPLNSAAALDSYRSRLSEAEIARVRALTADVAARFYPETTSVPDGSLSSSPQVRL